MFVFGQGDAASMAIPSARMSETTYGMNLEIAAMIKHYISLKCKRWKHCFGTPINQSSWGKSPRCQPDNATKKLWVGGFFIGMLSWLCESGRWRGRSGSARKNGSIPGGYWGLASSVRFRRPQGIGCILAFRFDHLCWVLRPCLEQNCSFSTWGIKAIRWTAMKGGFQPYDHQMGHVVCDNKMGASPKICSYYQWVIFLANIYTWKPHPHTSHIGPANDPWKWRRFCPPRMPRTCGNNWSSCALRHMMCSLKNGAFIWLSRWDPPWRPGLYPMETTHNRWWWWWWWWSTLSPGTKRKRVLFEAFLSCFWNMFSAFCLRGRKDMFRLFDSGTGNPPCGKPHVFADFGRWNMMKQHRLLSNTGLAGKKYTI